MPPPLAATPTPAPLDIHVGLIPATASSPIIVPTQEGQFAAKGLNVSLEPVTDTAQAMVSVTQNQYQIGNVTMGSAALNAFNRGTDLKIIAAGGADPAGHGANLPLIVRSQLIDSGAVMTVADLKGRKVAINGKGVVIEYALMKALKTGGLTANDVDVQILPFPDMVVAMSTGAIDAALLLQPTGAQAVFKGLGKILLDDYNQNAQNAFLVVNSRFLDQHRDAITSFLEVYMQSIRRLSDGRLRSDDAARADLQQVTNSPPDVIKLGPDPFWPQDGHVPLDINKLIDYGPLNDALKAIGSS
ncbi:MAG TPA: ABC transporter substrate-binding protein [Chloroflexota bacterium]